MQFMSITPYMGIDLGLSLHEPTTGCCILSEESVLELKTVSSLLSVTELIGRYQPHTVAIDAPLTQVFNKEEGVYQTRMAETLLRKLQNSCCQNPRFAPLSPNMILNLSVRGMTLKNEIEKHFPKMPVIEVHPTTSREFLDLPHHKNRCSLFSAKPLPWNTVKPSLEKRYQTSLPDLQFSITNPHSCDAFIAGITALLYAHNQTRNFGHEEQGGITVPQPAKVEMVFFDMDGTLTLIESPWRHVHESLQIWDNRAVLYFQEWLDGKIDYQTFCQKEVSLWNQQNADMQTVTDHLSRIPLNPYNTLVFESLKMHHIPTIIISTGFIHTGLRIAEQVQWKELDIRANELIENTDLSNRIQARIHVSADHDHPTSKGFLIEKICKEKQISKIRTLAIGDNYISDQKMFEQCGGMIFIQKPEDILNVLSFFPQEDAPMA